jgi:hypothetical protein
LIPSEGASTVKAKKPGRRAGSRQKPRYNVENADSAEALAGRRTVAYFISTKVDVCVESALRAAPSTRKRHSRTLMVTAAGLQALASNDVQGGSIVAGHGGSGVAG